ARRARRRTPRATGSSGRRVPSRAAGRDPPPARRSRTRARFRWRARAAWAVLLDDGEAAESRPGAARPGRSGATWLRLARHVPGRTLRPARALARRRAARRRGRPARARPAALRRLLAGGGAVLAARARSRARLALPAGRGGGAGDRERPRPARPGAAGGAPAGPLAP